MRNTVIWTFAEVVLLMGVSTCVKETRECTCGYGGLCLKNYIGDVQTPCGRLCETISGGFYDDCSVIVDHCASSPCQQGASCVSTWGSYFCKCPDEYYGQRCEIHSPKFKTFGMRAHEVYVYYQVQPRPDGTNRFHVIYNLQSDFKPRNYDDDYDDDDDDVKAVRLVFGGINLLLNVTVSDGRVFYPLRKKYLRKEFIKARCFRESSSNPELYDERICSLLPNGRVSVFSFDPTFYEGYYDEKLATRIALTDPQVSGVAGTVLVQAHLIDSDLKNYMIFNGSYKTFTYTRYRSPNNCERPVTFTGCSQSKEEAGLLSRGSYVRITRLHDLGKCEGVLFIRGQWYIQENVERNSYGKYDPVPKLIESTNAPAKYSDDELSLKSRYLKPGLHMFMYAEHLRGTPPYHGSQEEFAVYGRCWVRIIVKKPEFTTVGGIVQSVSCYHSLGVELALKGRPSYSQFDLSEFRITWRCNYTSDVECKPFDMPSHKFTKLLTPCNTTYLFTFRAVHKKAIVAPVSFEMIVRFEDIEISMLLECEFNCYPIDPNFRLLVVAVTVPYIKGIAFWEVYNDKSPVVSKYSNLTIFPASGASRILRIDGGRLMQEKQYTSNVNITATMVKDAMGLRVKDVSRCVNMAIVVGTFSLVHPQPSVYRYKSDRLLEGNLPFTFTVYSFNSKLKWFGYFTEVRTTKTEELVFTSRGNRIQMCVKDVYHSENCKRPARVHVNSKRVKIEVEQVKISAMRGDIVEFLSDVLNYMLDNIIFETDGYGSTITIRWNYTIEDRWELLQVISQVRERITGLQDKLSAFNLVSNYFLSRTGGSYDGLPIFIEDTSVGVDFATTVRWMEIRNRALELLTNVVGSAAYISWKYRHDYKLNTTPNGDSLTVLARGFALVYHQRIEILFSNYAVSKDTITWKWLAGEVAYWDKQNSRSELKLLLNICNHFSGAAIPFHGLRTVGNDDLRFYTVSSSYFGIVSYFNKSRPKEETFPGHTDFVFGPDDSSTNSISTNWLRFMRVQLPPVNWNFSSVFSLVVYTAKNLKNDRTSSPELYVHLRQRNDEGPLISKLPDGQQIECSLPFMWEGELGHQRTLGQFFTNETIVQPSARDPNTPWRYMLAFQVHLRGTYEEYAFSVVQLNPPPPWELQVKLFDAEPSYEDFTPNDSFPQCPSDCAIERDNSTKYTRNGSLSLLEMIMRPHSGLKYLPQVFYFGVMLPKSVRPGVYTIGIKSVETECVTEDLATATKQNCVSRAIRYNDTSVTCKCSNFGRIRILPHAQKRILIFIDPLVVGVNEVVDGLRIFSFVFSGVVALTAIMLLAISLIRDRLRMSNKRFAFKYTLDSYPGKAEILIVGVVTGFNPLAGTSSNVAVKVFGTESNSRVHVLQSHKRKHFDWMGDNWFLIPLESPLGIITHIDLWHDFHCNSDWFCARILMLDYNIHQWYLFEINRWFKLYPSDEESSVASFTPLVPSALEVELSAHIFFASYYARELKNTHIPASLFTLHPRYIGTYEQQYLTFLVKVFAIIFLTWTVKVYDLFKVDPRLGHATRLTWPTLFGTLCIAFMSHAFTLPGHIIYRWSVKSWSLQKRTTHRMVHFSHEHLHSGHHIYDHDHDHDRIHGHSDSRGPEHSGSQRRGSSTSPGGRSQKLSSPIHHEPGRKSHKKSPNPSSQESNGSHDQPWLNGHRQSWWDKLAKRMSISTNAPLHAVTPQIPKATAPMVLFGPCQYWAVNVDVVEARHRMKCVNIIARCILGGFWAVLCCFCLYSELFTAYWHDIEQTCFFAVVALLVDAIFLEPLLIFIKVLLAFSVFGITDADLHFWTQRGKKHDFPQPPAYLPVDYLNLVTRSQYHPLTSVQLKAKRFEQSMLLATRWSFYYVVVFLLAYSSYRQVSWERHFTTWAYLEATHASFKERFRHHSVSAAGVADVVDNKMAVQYLVHNFVSNEAYDLFKSGKHISRNHRVWGRDLYSSPTGVTNVIMLQSSNKSRRPVIMEDFRRYFRTSWTNFGHSTPETGPIKVGLKKREYKNSDTDWAIKSQSISGRSGESYPFNGQSWDYKMVPWANYYSDARDDFETLFFKEGEHRLHALIMQANYFCPYVPGISTVIVVIERLPNGMSTALIHTQFIQVGDFDDSKSKYPALFFRTLNCILFIIIFWFNVFLMCKLGLSVYFTNFQLVLKWLLLCTSCVNSYMAAYQYYRRFQTFHRVVDNQEAFVNVYGLTAADSTVLGFIFFLVTLEILLLLHWWFNLASMRISFYWCARMVLVGMVYEASRLKLCDFFLFSEASGMSLMIAVHLKEAKAWITSRDDPLRTMVTAILLAAAYFCFCYFKSAVVYKVLCDAESPKRAATGFDECASVMRYVRHRLCKGRSGGTKRANPPKHSTPRDAAAAAAAAADQPIDAPSQRSQLPESRSWRRHYSAATLLSRKWSLLN